MAAIGLQATDASGPTQVSHSGASGLTLAPIKLASFSIEMAATSTVVAVTVTGDADMDVVERLGHYLTGLHQEVSRLRLTEVLVDVQRLRFINSSCLRHFGIWLARLAKAGEGERYRVTMSLNPAVAWQKRSFEPLQYVAPGLVTVL